MFMDFLPIFFDIRGRFCAVIGGGDVAARKISLLTMAGGRVTVTAPELCAALSRRVRAAEIIWREEVYAPNALDGAALVIAATQNREVNAQVSRDAKALGIPVNVVDDPELCTFVMPAIIDRSPLVVAVSTGGASPVLSRLVRARLESLIPASYGELAKFAERFRERVKTALPSELRRRFWEGVLQGPVAELVLSGRDAEAEECIVEAITKADPAALTRGEVYFVGAGSGNPDHLTFAALRVMQHADVVLYDGGITPAILNLVRRDAEHICVGGVDSLRPLPQTEVTRLIVKFARMEKRVLRLEAGHIPLVGGDCEEMEVLAHERIPFQVVPGVSVVDENRFR